MAWNNAHGSWSSHAISHARFSTRATQRNRKSHHESSIWSHFPQLCRNFEPEHPAHALPYKVCLLWFLRPEISAESRDFRGLCRISNTPVVRKVDHARPLRNAQPLSVLTVEAHGIVFKTRDAHARVCEHEPHIAYSSHGKK